MTFCLPRLQLQVRHSLGFAVRKSRTRNLINSTLPPSSLRRLARSELVLRRTFCAHSTSPEHIAQDLFRQVNAILDSQYLSKEEAELDAQSLLLITSSPEIISQYTSDREQGQQSPETKLLHRAFLHLTSKNLAHSSPIAIPLTERAHKYGLWFHLPLYKQIVLNAATHSSIPAVDILEMTSYAVKALHVTLEPAFFASAVQMLIQRSLFRDALTVLTAMRNLYDIRFLPKETTLPLLMTLDSKLVPLSMMQLEDVDPSVLLDSVVSMTDASDLLDTLAVMLGRPDVVSSDDDTSLVNRIAHILERQQENEYEDDDDMSIGEEIEDDDDLEFDFDNDDDGFSRYPDFCEAFDHYDGISSCLEKVLKNVDEQRSKVSNPPPYREDFLKNVIYWRNQNRKLRLPDVSDQLAQLNDGKTVLYSEHFEYHLVQSMAFADEDEANDK